MKVLMAPVNIAGQPVLAVRELRRQGVDVSLLQYTFGSGHAFGYETDRVFDLSEYDDRLAGETAALKQALDEGVDIFHFWMATLFANGLRSFHGLDLPFIKARGRRIVYRGTGFDLRTASAHAERNPYNPFRYGVEQKVDEETQQAYIAYLKEYVDMFIVQDPEMHEFMPQARIVPRGIELDRWPEVGIEPNGRPLVVHAPSKGPVKGTDHLLKAVEELQAEGVDFEFRLVQGMPHEEAVELYKQADVIVDQLLIGWYGVLTIEALALGKPVLVYVRDDLFEQFTPAIPVHNANPDTVKERLRELVTDYELRRSLAERGRRFVEEVHDIRNVASSLKGIYDEVMQLPVRQPDAFTDLDYFARQLRPDKELRAKARRYDRFVDALDDESPDGMRLRLSWAIASMKFRSLPDEEKAAELARLRRNVRNVDLIAPTRGLIDFDVDPRTKVQRYDRFTQALDEDTVEGAKLRLAWARSAARYTDRSPELLEQQVGSLRKQLRRYRMRDFARRFHLVGVTRPIRRLVGRMTG